MADQPKQPVIVLLTSHWITMAGVALVTLAGFSWLFALPTSLRGNVGNPYIGLLVFMAIPAVFFAGLVLIPIGIALGRHRAVSGLGEAADRRAALDQDDVRRMGQRPAQQVRGQHRAAETRPDNHDRVAHR